jgi:hypothetical protein
LQQQSCHPERSEGPVFCWLPQDASVKVKKKQILRYAQDDNSFFEVNLLAMCSMLMRPRILSDLADDQNGFAGASRKSKAAFPQFTAAWRNDNLRALPK